MMNRRQMAIAAALLLGTALPSTAQGRGRSKSAIPPGQRPPAGMCRIWIDGVPPGRQPAPTDCRKAILNRPANARIIYGDRASASRRKYDSSAARRIHDANGDVFMRNNKRCVRRVDANGRVRTECREVDDHRTKKPGEPDRRH